MTVICLRSEAGTLCHHDTELLSFFKKLNCFCAEQCTCFWCLMSHGQLMNEKEMAVIFFFFLVTVPTYVWRDWGLQGTSFMTACLQNEIGDLHLPS
jgi:hypothetical protein